VCVRTTHTPHGTVHRMRRRVTSHRQCVWISLSINQSKVSSQSHTRARRGHIPAMNMYIPTYIRARHDERKEKPHLSTGCMAAAIAYRGWQIYVRESCREGEGRACACAHIPHTAPCTVCVGVSHRIARVCEFLCQSINQRSPQSHTRAREKPHTSTTTGGQQTLHHEVMQAWGAVNESRQH